MITAGNADNTHTVTTKNRNFVRSYFGQIFTLNSWIGRAFRNYRYQPYVQGMQYTDYLPRPFKWFEEVQRCGYEHDPDVGKTRVRTQHLCRHWLSDMFGFYNFNEMVVQVNPIEIFFLQFLPEDKRCFGCENIRIIGNIDDMSSEWAFNRFEY